MSETVTIYHNPRCSKSRQTLRLIEDQGIIPEVVLYLETPPSESQLKTIIKQLGIDARQLLRKSESEYSELNLKDTTLGEMFLIDAMAKHPKLIERPIVVKNDKAVIGRPPENVLNLLGMTL
jgi:arsenate reductase